MLIWTDHLSRSHLVQTVDKAVPHCQIEVSMFVKLARVRRYRYNVKLFNPNSKRWTNTGKRGAGNEHPGTWDDYGKFLAAVFKLDPNAVAGWYKNAEDFRVKTKGRY